LEGDISTATEVRNVMTKWVTFLLLVLAVLAFGLSRMRPVPQEPSPTASETVMVSETPDPQQSQQAAESTGGSAPKRPIREPKFGIPKEQPEAVEGTPGPGQTPGAVAAASKKDPFASKKNPDPVAGTVKATILSTSAGGPARSKFPIDAESIYLTATPQGLKDEVELVASYRSVMDEKAEFSDPVGSSGPARRRSFRLLPPESGWETGPYQIAIKAKTTGQVLGLERFEIVGPKEPLEENFPDPEYLDLVPDLEANEPQSTFNSKDPQILLRVSAQKLEPGTIIRSVWSAVEVDRLTNGELIAVTTEPAPGPGKDAVFTFQPPPGGFHSGSYRVDVYFDQMPAGSQAFFIQPPATDKDSPST